MKFIRFSDATIKFYIKSTGRIKLVNYNYHETIPKTYIRNTIYIFYKFLNLY